MLRVGLDRQVVVFYIADIERAGGTIKAVGHVQAQRVR